MVEQMEPAVGSSGRETVADGDRQVAEHQRMAALAVDELARRRQLLPRELPNERVAPEQRVAVVGRDDPEQALVDE